MELEGLGYSRYEIEELLNKIRQLVIYVESEPANVRKARDLSKKRDVPLLDAVHALIARDYRAMLVTLDRHFLELLDIAKPYKPDDFI